MTVNEQTSSLRVEKIALRLLMPAEPAVEHPRKSAKNDNQAHYDTASQRCGLPQCRKSRCNLASHKNYVAARRKQVRPRTTHESVARSESLKLKLVSAIVEHSVLRIERQIADGLPALSIQHGGSSTFRELTHHYFVNQIDRLIQVFSPLLDRQKYRATMFEHAQTNDVFCICIAANAKTDMLMRGHVRTADAASKIVYATAAQVLRQRLDNFDPRQIDWLLVLVIALVGFDLAFERVDVLSGHYEALKRLIALKGGIHAVGHIRPYVLGTDRFLAIYTGQYPIVKQTPVLSTLPKETQIPNPYGKAFEESKVANQIDRQVLQYCKTLCQLIHTMESWQVSLEPHTRPASDPSAIPYYLYLRDHLGCEGTCLYAAYHENQQSKTTIQPSFEDNEGSVQASPMLNRSRVVLLATLIVEYGVTHKNYYTVKSQFLAHQLKVVFEKQSLSLWSRHSDMLLWVLFIVAALTNHGVEREWALQKVREQLDIRYQGQWPESRWKDNLHQLLRKYIWSEYLQTLFMKVCVELLAGKG